MKKLNLAYPDKSEISYTISNFPDGQRDIVLQENEVSRQVRILTRFNTFQDLELVLCAISALKELYVGYISVEISYLLGGRSDRKFNVGGTSYLQDVILKVLDNCVDVNFVSVLDPHNLASLRTSKIESVTPYSLLDFTAARLDFKNTILLYPDKGSVPRIDNLIKLQDNFLRKVYCSKERNSSGKLTDTKIPLQDFNKKDILIIDDIGDGFGTFINLAKELKSRNVGNMYLMVTHTIQESGAKKALEHFTKIFTTNSIKDFNIEYLEVLDIFNKLC